MSAPRILTRRSPGSSTGRYWPTAPRQPVSSSVPSRGRPAAMGSVRARLRHRARPEPPAL
jgi:hypothetical protein